MIFIDRRQRCLLRSRPAAKEDLAYVPTRWIGE
jgi:hypothetical protein